MSVFGLQAGRYSRLPKSSGNHNKSFEMSTVAQQLRHAREAQKLTIEQVADITKIRTDHVRAIENVEYHVFSAPVYTRGFIRTYSNLVKLDPAHVVGSNFCYVRHLLDGQFLGFAGVTELLGNRGHF